MLNETIVCTFLQVILLPPGSAKIVNIHCWWVSTSIDYILQSLLL